WKSTEFAGLWPLKVAAVTVTPHLNGTWKFGAADAGACPSPTTPSAASASAATPVPNRRNMNHLQSSVPGGVHAITTILGRTDLLGGFLVNPSQPHRGRAGEHAVPAGRGVAAAQQATGQVQGDGFRAEVRGA